MGPTIRLLLPPKAWAIAVTAAGRSPPATLCAKLTSLQLSGSAMARSLAMCAVSLAAPETKTAGVAMKPPEYPSPDDNYSVMLRLARPPCQSRRFGPPGPGPESGTLARDAGREEAGDAWDSSASEPRVLFGMLGTCSPGCCRWNCARLQCRPQSRQRPPDGAAVGRVGHSSADRHAAHAGREVGSRNPRPATLRHDQALSLLAPPTGTVANPTLATATDTSLARQITGLRGLEPPDEVIGLNRAGRVRAILRASCPELIRRIVEERGCRRRRVA